MIRETTKLKEMYIVRYADDFRIFCRTKVDAEKTKVAVTKWFAERLKLEISEEKTKIVNVSRRHSDFLGFKIRVAPKGGIQVIRSHIADKNLAHKRMKLTEQVRNIAHPRKGYDEKREIQTYNSMVVGMHNYYQLATHVSEDFNGINRAVMTILTNRFSNQRGGRLAKSGRKLTKFERERYGASDCLRYIAGFDEPVYPISFVKHKVPLEKKRKICCYTVEGRELIHNSLKINTLLMCELMRQPPCGKSVEYHDNRISLFSAQWGKCAVTGVEFDNTANIHCHHIIPRCMGGTDKYGNLSIITEDVHRLIHSVTTESICKYMAKVHPSKSQLSHINALRQKANLLAIE